ITEHRLSDIVGGVGVVVGAQVLRTAEIDVDIFAAQFEAGLRYAVAELGIEYSDAGVSQQVAGVRIGSARSHVGTVVSADASRKARQEWRSKIKLAGIGQRIVELLEVSAHRPRESECIEAVDAGRIAGGKWRNGLGVGTQTEVAAEVLDA